jgi:hypothetical protein
MKKNILSISLAVLVAFIFASCKSSAPAVVTEQLPKYVDIAKVLSVEMGSTYDEVVKHFGSAPIDVVSRQKDGYSIYLYKYRIVYRDIDPRAFDVRGNEAAGPESYYGDLKNLYLFFKGGKLMDIQTEVGLGYSTKWVMINNTLYNISKNGTGYNTEAMAPAAGDQSVVPTENTDSKPAQSNDQQQSGKFKLPFFKSNK